MNWTYNFLLKVLGVRWRLELVEEVSMMRVSDKYFWQRYLGQSAGKAWRTAIWYWNGHYDSHQHLLSWFRLVGKTEKLHSKQFHISFFRFSGRAEWVLSGIIYISDSRLIETTDIDTLIIQYPVTGLNKLDAFKILLSFHWGGKSHFIFIFYISNSHFDSTFIMSHKDIFVFG